MKLLPKLVDVEAVDTEQVWMAMEQLLLPHGHILGEKQSTEFSEAPSREG